MNRRGFLRMLGAAPIVAMTGAAALSITAKTAAVGITPTVDLVVPRGISFSLVPGEHVYSLGQVCTCGWFHISRDHPAPSHTISDEVRPT